MVYYTLKIMHNIRREKYFDIVSEGKENISSVFRNFVVIGWDC